MSKYERAIEDIVGYIRDQVSYENDGDVDNILAELAEIGNVFDRCDIRMIVDEINYQIEVIADKNNKCPKCFNDYTIDSYKEIHSHLDDKPAEIFEFYKCERCGWDSITE